MEFRVIDGFRSSKLRGKRMGSLAGWLQQVGLHSSYKLLKTLPP